MAVRTRDLGCDFGDVRAVDEVSIDVPAGAIWGLLGPDGAGKSTLIRMLATVQRPTRGDADIFGHSVTRTPGRVTPRLGYMSQRFSMYPDLSVAENIEFFATLRGVPRRERGPRAHSLLSSMGLDEFGSRPAGKLSGGMKQKLMLACTLMHEPDLLLLDEPTTGVDPVSRREFWRILAGLHRVGKTVIVSTPYMDEAEQCTEVAFLDGGRLRHRGSPQQLKSLVPGVLLEITADQPRSALAVVGGVTGVLGAHLYGDIVRVMWNPALEQRTLTDALALAGRSATVRPVPVDMETAFAHLAEESDREAVAS